MGQHRDDQIGIRIPYKATKIRRRYDRAWRRASIPCIAVVLFAALFSALFAFQYLSHDTDVDWRFARGDRHVGDGNQIGVVFAALNRSTGIRGLGFGRGSGRDGRDSRYWDGDDRRRDGEYEEEEEKERKAGEGSGVGELYNEAGRDELLKYEKYGESLGRPDRTADGDEYDDGIDVDDVPADGIEDAGRGSDNKRALSEEGSKSKFAASAGGSLRFGNGSKSVEMDGADSSSGKLAKKSRSKRKSRRHSGSCEMKLLESTSQLLEPLQSKKFSRFSIQYTKSEERPSEVDNWQPRFAGHQSLQERENSFYARDQKMNCGFVNGPKGQLSTGFDLAEDDIKFMSSCHIAVSSCIFGSSDNLRTPYSRTITRSSRKNVCFVMFMDESTLQTLSSEGHQPDSMRFIGLWRIVVVKNLPYNDMRRVGKIPKFLTHRLFPSARYSIWLDSKLRLQRDPVLLLEYFLWRKGHEYAISNHYDRHCVWEEVLQNKKLNKFNHTTIDEQFKFYQADGLRKFDPSDPNKMLPSYVPEGSFILREHTPMSNLFSCLWFNEVDRFTPRDQLSFAHTYLKLRRMNPEKPFYLNMFKDCERRSIAKLFRHRSESQRTSPLQAVA